MNRTVFFSLILSLFTQILSAENSKRWAKLFESNPAYEESSKLQEENQNAISKEVERRTQLIETFVKTMDRNAKGQFLSKHMLTDENNLMGHLNRKFWHDEFMTYSNTALAKEMSKCCELKDSEVLKALPKDLRNRISESNKELHRMRVQVEPLSKKVERTQNQVSDKKYNLCGVTVTKVEENPDSKIAWIFCKDDEGEFSFIFKGNPRHPADTNSFKDKEYYALLADMEEAKKTGRPICLDFKLALMGGSPDGATPKLLQKPTFDPAFKGSVATEGDSESPDLLKRHSALVQEVQELRKQIQELRTRKKDPENHE